MLDSVLDSLSDCITFGLSNISYDSMLESLLVEAMTLSKKDNYVARE